jgi:hypothetical protein
MVEHAAVNRVVEGSSPSSGAILFSSAFFEVLALTTGFPAAIDTELTPNYVAAANFNQCKLTPRVLVWVTTFSGRNSLPRIVQN